jgi:hypothetical protein
MASLIVVGRKDGEHSLAGDVTVIGRDRGVGLELGDFQVSRRHALVIQTDDGCFLKDLGSRNGVLLNKTRVPARRQQKLKNGDVVTLGRTSLVFKDLEMGPLPEAAIALLAQPVVRAKPEKSPSSDEKAPENGAPEKAAESPIAEKPVAEKPVAEKPLAEKAPEKPAAEKPAPEKTPLAKAEAPAAAAAAARKPVVARARFQELAADDVASGVARGGDQVALRQLLRRAERERVFYRNLTLGLVGFLMLVLVALLFYSLGRRESHTEDGSPPARSGKADKTGDAGPARGETRLQRVPGPVSVTLGRAGELDARAFSDTILPLLERTCATAGCHMSPGPSDFALDPRTTPSAVSKNLEVVRRYVVPGHPERSPLLTKALRRDEGGEEHGGGDLLSASSPAYQTLHDWIAKAAPRPEDEARPKPRPTFSGTDGQDEKPGVSAVHPRPVARISTTASSVAPGTALTFDGTGSSDAEGGELQYRWTLVDRPDKSKAELAGPLTTKASLIADVEGSYLVVLVVTSSAGASSEPARLTIECTPGATAPKAPEKPAEQPKRTSMTEPASRPAQTANGLLKGAQDGRAYVREVMIDLLGRGPRPEEMAASLDKTREDFVAELFTREELYREWYEEQLLYFLLIDNFRPAEDPAELAGRLKSKELSARDAIQATVIGQYFNQRNPGNDTFVTVVLEQLLGLKVQEKQNKKLLEAGKKMYDGYASTLFGKTGKNQADVVKIVAGERGFTEHLLRRSYKQVTGLELDAPELAPLADRLEKDPGAFFEVEKGWVLSAKYLERVPLQRTKTERAFIRTLFVDLLDRVPEEEELRNARNALRALADPGPLKAVLAKVLLDSPKAHRASDGDAESFVKNQFVRLLARDPKPGELAAFKKALDEGTSRDTIVRALVTSAEYEGY